MNRPREWFTTLLAAALGTIFLVSGAMKIASPWAFFRAVENYRLVPEWAAAWSAVVLPWWEAGVGLGVCWPQTRRICALGALMLGGLFAMAVSSALLRGLDITCGCFGQGSGAVGWRTLALDLLVMAGAAILRWDERSRGAADPDTPKTRRPA